VALKKYFEMGTSSLIRPILPNTSVKGTGRVSEEGSLDSHVLEQNFAFQQGEVQFVGVHVVDELAEQLV